MLESLGELGVFRGVFHRKTCDATGSFGVIVMEEERFAVGRRSEQARIRVQHVALVFLELHVCGDVRAKRADGVRESGCAEAGMKFFSDGAAANEFAALKD